jgi:SEC-C motif
MSNLIELDVRKAIYAAQGSVTTAAELLRLGRPELKHYLSERPHLQEFILNLREEVVDDCQAVLGDAVEESAPWAVRFTLKTIGAYRGYVEGAVQPKIDDIADNAQVAQPATTANPEPATPDNNHDAVQKERETQLLARLPEHVVADALEHAKGHIGQAANALGVPRAYVRKVIALCRSLREVLFHEREKLVDRAEDVLREAVKEKSRWAINFVLNTRGRDRGYGRPAKPSRRARLMANAVPDRPATNSGDFTSVGASVPEPLNQFSAKSEEMQPNVPLAARVSAGTENHLADRPANPVKAPAAPSNKPRTEVLNRIGADLSSNQPILGGQESVGRNAPCPCNSGMKFKRCCGR